MNEKENKLLLNKMSSPRNVVGDLPLTWLLFLGRHCGHGSAIQGFYKEKITLLNRLDPGSTPGMTTKKAKRKNLEQKQLRMTLYVVSRE